MVTKYLKLFTATLVALFALAACQNERTIDLYGEGGDLASTDVVFTIKDYDEVNLRSHLRPEDEHRIESMVIWVFDKQGRAIGKPIISHAPEDDFGFIANVAPGIQSGGSTDKGIPFGGTQTKGQIGGQLKLKLKNLSDQMTIVGLANFDSENFALEETDGTAVTTDVQFMAIDDIEKLRALRLNINRKNHSATSSERYESPLMYAYKAVTLKEIKEGIISIQMVPYIAKISTKIVSGNEVTINSIKYHYQSIPTYTHIYNAVAKNQDGSKIRPLNTPTTQMLYDSADDSYRSEGYLMPNYAVAQKLITKEDVSAAQARKDDGKSGYTAFDLRQKRIKTASPTVPYKFDNGDWEYAPKEATAFVMQADITVNKEDGTEQRATVDYTVVLGDFSGVTSWTNPTDTDLKKINNYFIESATHYVYTITINGVDNIIVEATSTSELDEPNPSVEGGTVVGDKAAYVLDSHYEQRTVLLNASDFDIFSDVNTKSIKPNAKLQFLVETPFQPNTIISYNPVEAKSARINGVPKEKQVDNDWIRIYVHDPIKQKNRVFDNANLPELIYTNTDEVATGASVSNYTGKALTVEQFFTWLFENPAPLFDAKDNICITIFVDEYFYEWDPSKLSKQERNVDNKDKDLWKVFANAPDRKFFLLTDNVQTSADQKSTYIRGTYLSLIQHSIKTFFTDSPQGVRVWGVESIDETPNIAWCWVGPGISSRWMTHSLANGWINTWNVMAGSHRPLDTAYNIGGYADYIRKNYDPAIGYIMTEIDGKFGESGENNYKKKIKLWPLRTRGASTGVTFGPDRALIGSGFQQNVGMYTPFLRNRDVNRDGLMQANELKWYIPSQFEAEMLVMFEQALPGYARLKAPKNTTFKNPLVLYTSTAYNEDARVYSSNNVVITVPGISATPIYQALSGNFSGAPASNIWNLRSTTRLIRDLGIIEKSSIEDKTGWSYNLDNIYYVRNANKFMRFIPNIDGKDAQTAANNFGGVFVGYQHLSPSTVRYAFADGELPKHNEFDSSMRVYYKGFRLSSRYIGSSDYDKDKQFRWDYDTLNDLLRRGKSPCKEYYENADQSDKGTWRLPNMSEMAIMALTVPHNSDYFFFNNKKNGNKVFNVWSSTRPSAYETRTSKNGFFMRVGDNITYPMGYDAPGYSFQVDDWKNYVRCVRDLTDAEWNKYKNK